MRTPNALSPATVPPPQDPVLASGSVAAAPAVALPAGAGAAAATVAVVVLAAAGVGWNSLGPREKARATGAVTGFFVRQVQTGKMTVGQLGSLITGVISAGVGGAQGVLQRSLTSAQRSELQSSVMAAAYEPPTPDQLQAVVDSLVTVQDCRKKPRGELVGQCGKCTADAFGELRKLRIRAQQIDLSEILPNVKPGVHYMIKVLTTAGEYILDCTFGQFGGADFKGPNVFFGRLEEYARQIAKMTGRVF
jgi:hypothetical protein